MTTTALITGIAGQDGTYLAELLAGKGYRVVGTSRSRGPDAMANPNVELVRADVTDANAIAALIAEVRPSEIYHLAAQSSVGASFAKPVDTFRTNAGGTVHVLEAARRLDPTPKVLVAASGEVFGDTGGVPANERTPLRPLNPYSASKAAAVHAAQSYRAAYGLRASVAYLYNHESPLRGPQFVTRKVARMACRIARGLERSLELGDCTVVRDWGWAPDYTDALFRMLQLDEPDDFVLASGKSISLQRFVDVAFARVGLRSSDHVVPNRSLYRSVDIPVMRADPSHAAERLGWRTTVHGEAVAERLVDAEFSALDAELSR